MTNRLELNWKVDGFVDEQRYYCSETPIDPENLPPPKVILAGDVRTRVDTVIEIGKTYYVCVGSVKNGVEKIGEQKTVAAYTFDFIVGRIFSNSELGFAFDPNDLSTLYQDANGTIPVTAAGQFVALMLDKSGNNLHAMQVNPLKRPVLRQNPLTGAYYINTDGSNQFLITANLDLSTKDKLSVFTALKSTASAPYGQFFGLGGDVNGGVQLFYPGQASGQAHLYLGYSGAASVKNIVMPTSAVLSMVLDRAQAGYNTEIVARVNGAAASDVTGGANPSRGAVTGNFINSYITIGMRSGKDTPFNGDIYCLTGVARVTTPEEIAEMEMFLARRIGINI